jgi:hypothetical protein
MTDKVARGPVARMSEATCGAACEISPDVASLMRASAAKLAAIPAGASPADIGVQSMS